MSACRALALAGALMLAVAAPAAEPGDPAAQSGATTFRAAPVRAVTAIPVAPGVWRVQGAMATASADNEGFIANAGFVVTDAGVLVVDSLGSPALAEAFIAAIRRVTAQPIRIVVATHYHADHAYGLAAFKAAGAEIIAHAAADAYLASPAAAARLHERQQTLAKWIGPDLRPLSPDRRITADTTLQLGATRFRILAASGHTPEDLAVFVEGTRVLFTGDLVFAERLPFIGEADTAQWLRALDRLADLQPSAVVSGHGPSDADPLASLRFTRDYLERLRMTMQRAVDDLTPFADAYAATDWSADAHRPLFAESHRSNAYNTYLQLEREALAAPGGSR